MNDLVYIKAVEYLKKDFLKNLSTLKYLSLYKDKLTVNLIENNSDWAILVRIPTKILSYDKAVYPTTDQVVFLNGTSDQLKYKLLESLPKNNYILKLNKYLDLTKLKNQFKIKEINSFLSYSCSTIDNSRTNIIVPGNNKCNDEINYIIKKNGYSESVIKKHFDNGAVWFGFRKNDTFISACFIYQNYSDIWEIAGVHTLKEERNRGYARIVVISALTYILKRNMKPRYVTDIQNTNSIKLAESLKMKQFLRINHYLLES